MGSELRVPTITHEDLKAFQARNFPFDGNKHGDQDREGEDDDEDDDDLGYYPDGVKRTLTNEQVAMFRHSEIYALFRQRQIRQENLEAGIELQPENPAWGASSAIVAKATSAIEGRNEDIAEDGSDEEEEYARFLEAEKRKADAIQARKKRKISHANGYDNRGRPATHRRIARELDIVVADEQVLDYGEESSKSTDISKDTVIQDKSPKDDEPEQQTHEVSRAALQKNYLPVEGRKIWWPTIGKKESLLDKRRRESSLSNPGSPA